jgi:hypothetical protein
MKTTSSFFKGIFVSVASVLLVIPGSGITAEVAAPWEPLFNGTNLDGWMVQLRGQNKNEDPARLVQIEEGALHFYKDAAADSQQPFGYIATEQEYSSYRLRLEFKWGGKKFAPRTKSVRDSGLLYHVTPTDKVWPDCVEYQIQENDVGDIYAVSTQVTSPADPQTTNMVVTISTNKTSGAIRTNSSAQLRFMEITQGGVPFVQGRVGTSLRVIRNPLNEREGWNTVEIEVRGDSATHRINGVINNRCFDIKQSVNGNWVPLHRGRIALQLEGAEVLYRKIEIQELQEAPAIAPTERLVLFDGKSLSGWTFISKDTNQNPARIWSVTDGVIRCAGRPNGYARTLQSYRDYQLHLEWRWPDGPGNSGVFLNLDGADKVWPRCLEAQLASGKAGEVRMNGDATADGLTPENSKSIPPREKSSEKSVGDWNSYDITCRSNTMTVRVNGVLQNQVTGASVSSGAIGLQAEGKPVEFRNIWVEPVATP